MASKIILLNGPKACGKNVAVDRIKESINVVDRRCKDHLFKATSVLFKMTLEEFFVHYECRETKETPKKEFEISVPEFNRLAPIIKVPLLGVVEATFGPLKIQLSVREALIYVSEIVCKPAFGRDYFGTARAAAVDVSSGNECAIDDSCGFDDEIPPTIERLGVDNVMLIRILGRGNFDGDSRNYIQDGVVSNTVDVYNTGTEEDFLDIVNELASDFYKQ
jgi:hypothetical protein